MIDSPRRSYEDSCGELLARGLIEDLPPLPPQRPLHDDEALGISFFRTLLADEDLSNMTIPRTFFGRSEIRSVSFRNTDLSESTLCWNDFVEVDFTACTLGRSDMRAAMFKTALFTNADLCSADLRRSTFDGCDFSGADLRGAKLTREQGAKLRLSQGQAHSILWQDDGDEPGGG